ncbi:MAG TPA: chemotaxis protein CheB [Xanthobacteraceae bacterium]|jgi:two-component system chemotaxis response regulator CheB|nr:chemotaxis protein CheB [Xanthobacteraceae bacterium]
MTAIPTMSANSAEAVVIGASAGALEALSVILPALPAEYRLPVIIVVHIPPDKRSVLVELFQAKCAVKVEEAEDKIAIRDGTAYFAPPDYHLLIERDKSLSLSSDEPVLFSRPSIDVLFESAADAYGPALIGVLLTGASQDGAHGMKAIVESGGMAIVQDPHSAFAPAMPEAAIAACPGALVLSLQDIATYLGSVQRQ